MRASVFARSRKKKKNHEQANKKYGPVWYLFDPRAVRHNHQAARDHVVEESTALVKHADPDIKDVESEADSAKKHLRERRNKIKLR